MDLTMNDRKKFALGILIGIGVVSLLAFVPSLTDFNSGQFSTTGNKVTIADSVLLTNAGLKSATVYQVDTNTVALRVFGYNSNGRTNMIQQWLAIPYPGGSPNVVASIDTNGVLTTGGGVTTGPSGVRLTDTTTGKYWQWSELNAASNIIERLPTNGNNGLSWGIKMWTNAAIASDGTPTNQAMNFQLGNGLSVDWANRQIASSPIRTIYGVDYNPTSAGTSYNGLAGGASGGATESTFKTYVTHNRTLTNFWVHRSEGGWTAGTNIVVTIRTNGVNTGLSVTLDGSTYVASNLTTSATVVVGDNVTVGIVLNSAVNSTHLIWSLEEY